MNAASDTPKDRHSSRAWRWVKRVLLGFLALVLLLLVFHQSLLRFAIDRIGRHYAKAAGYQLDWTVGGNMRSDVTLRDVKVTGRAGDPIKKIEWRQGSADYDLRALLKKGLGSFLRDLHLDDADVEIDARAFAENKQGGGGSVKDFWIDQIHLRNINVRVITAQGDAVIKGLSLALEENKPGELSIDELNIPWANLHLTGVRGRTEVKNRKVLLTDLALDPRFSIPRLAVDLQKIKQGSLGYEIELRSGEATISSSGTIDHLGGDISLDAVARVERLTDADVSRWIRLPPNLSWRVERVLAKISGRPNTPRSLAGDISIENGAGSFPGVKCDELQARLALADGAFHLQSLQVRSGANSLEASADGELPPSWNEISAASGDLRWKLSAPELATVYAPAKLAGNLHGNGSLALRQGRITAAEAMLNGTQLELWQKRIGALDAVVTTDMQSILLKKISVRLDEKNNAEVSGSVALADRQTAKISWELNSRDLATPARLAGLEKSPLPESGEFSAQGTAMMDVADLWHLDFSKLMADGAAQLGNVAWRKAKLEAANLQFSARQGKAEVKQLLVRFNDRNQAAFQGRFSLDKTGEFEGEANATLEQLTDLSGWSQLAGLPAITSGSASITWKGKGGVASRDVAGTGALRVANLKFAGETESLSAVLEARHEGDRAEISRLEGTAGKFRVEAKAQMTAMDLDVSKVAIFAERTPLLNGSLHVPLKFGDPGRAIPIDPDRPMQVGLSMEKLEVGKLFGIVGQKPPLRGTIAGTIDLNGKIPDLGGRVSMTMTGVSSDATKGKLAPATLRMDATLSRDQLQVVGTADQKPLRTFSAEASLPFDAEKLMREPKAILDSKVAGRIALPDSDLDVVRKFVPQLAAIHGTGGADVRFSGPLRSPQWEGAIHADASSAALKDSEMDIKNLKARMSFKGQRITLDDVSTILSGGELRAGGAVDLTDLANPAVDLRLDAKQALIVRDETMSLRADGSVTAKGTLKNSVVQGRMELVRGRIFKEIEFLPLSGPSQLPPPPPPVRNTSANPSLPPPFDQWTFDVDIATRDSVRLLGNVLNGGAVAGLHATGTGAAPVLEGKVSLEGARIRLPFSRLDITKGELIFSRDKPWDPQIDVQGDSQIGNYLVTAYVYGSAYQPQIRLTSSPPLQENEIATLLATGSAAGDVRTAPDELANRATFMLVTKLYRSLFHKETPKRYDAEPPKFTLSFSPLASAGAQKNGAGDIQRIVSATYEISPHYHLVASAGERGFRGMLYYLVRFR